MLLWSKAKTKKIAIVIPAHNEELSLPKVLNKLAFYLPEDFEKQVFVVDDGSKDNTSAVAEENGANVVRHPISLGVGGALKTGYFLAKDWGPDIIVQMDADGEHDPAELPKFLDIILNEEVDMVIGSRFINGLPQLSFTRRVGISFFTWIVNKLAGYRLTDITNGYRVFKAEHLDKIIFPSEKHWAIEMTLLAGKHKLKIKEVAINATNRKFGKSQFSNLITFFLYPINAIKQIIDVYI